MAIIATDNNVIGAGLALISERDQMRSALIAALTPGRATNCSAAKINPSDVRAWAARYGVPCSKRGRIDAGLMRAYQAAEGKREEALV